MADPAPRPAAPAPPAPAVVSRFEFHLLRLVRFLLGHLPAEHVRTVIEERRSAPPCLSRVSVRVVEDTLAKGCVLLLVKGGGWRVERVIGASGPVTGRAWERTPLGERTLDFGPLPLAFLMWLTGEKAEESREQWDDEWRDLTPADELFFARAYQALKDFPAIAEALAARRVFRTNALCRLSYPADFGTGDALPDFAAWTTGLRALLLECLQPALAARWVKSERAKGQTAEWRRLRQTGEAEARTLDAFLASCEAANRPDLARFLLRTAATVLAPNDLTTGFWTGGLQGPAPPRLAERLETQRAALAVPRALDTLRRWDRQARTVGYYDEGYAASQVWKADWEAADGDALTAKAHAMFAELDPLRTG